MEAPELIILLEGLAITIIGSILHFTYAWSHQNKFVAIFSAVNESTWEHIKLALSGIFACTLVDVWFLGNNPNYWLARSVSFIVPVVVIPLFFYTYTHFTKKSILWVDISSFAVVSFLAATVFALILKAPAITAPFNFIIGVIAVAIIVAYLLLTRFPLHNFLFRDPITGQYGYDGHTKHRSQKHRHKH